MIGANESNWVRALAAYRERPIPDLAATLMPKKAGYRQHPIDVSDPRCQEPWRDALAAGLAGANHYFRTDNAPYYERIAGSIPQLFLRNSVLDKLLAIERRLKPLGLQLWLYDAWRPLAVQNHFHDHWMPDFLRRRDPGLEGEALWRTVEEYWAKGAPGGVVDPHSPPPHATGAAVDLTIRTLAGEPLFMGTIFDDVTAISHTDAYERAANPRLSFSDQEARANRRLLYWLMAEQGFCNNPTEWWHYSFGDQMWAKLTGQAAAIYSAVEPLGK